MILRGYQTDLVNGALAEWRNGFRRIAMVMATGGGKTPTAMTLAEMCIAAGQPVLWIAHRTELIDQAIDKAEQVAPGRRIGRMQGTTKQYRAEIVVGSVQTCSTAASLTLLRSRRWGLVIVDETHHVAAATYQTVLTELGCFEADGPLMLGVTATLDRADGLALGQTFEAVVDPRIGLLDLIRHPDGPYLVPPRGVRVLIDGLNLDKVRRVAGDFNSGHLGRAMSDAMAPAKIVEAWVEHSKGCPTVAFLPTVAFSIEQAQAFNDAGFVAVHLDGTTPAAERARVLDEFRAGRVDILCNVNLFVEGTDLPSIGCVILGAPTSSTNRYQQQVGRGLRLYPGKSFCWILDVTGVTKRHKLATLVNLNGADNEEETPDDLLMYEEDDLAGEADLPAEGEQGGDAEPVEYADGPLAHELVDLFGQSHSAWLRTDGGTWFLPAGQALLYLRPSGADHFDLCWTTTDAYPRHRGSGTIREHMEIGYAMAAGDEYVAARPVLQAERDAPWRSLPAPRHRGKTKGEVADEKARALANSLLDAKPEPKPVDVMAGRFPVLKESPTVVPPSMIPAGFYER
jgi:ATP-dependent helicase IRC3